MKPSPIVRDALGRAERARDAFAAATALGDASEAWREFLLRLERVWNKAEAHFSRSPKWGGWSAPFHRERRADELLRYLARARDVEEHSDGHHLEERRGHVSVAPGDSDRPAFATGVVDEGGAIRLTDGFNMSVAKMPDSLRMRPVTNRGATVQPPTSHLGKPIAPADFVAVADAGLRYYRALIESAEKKFYD